MPLNESRRKQLDGIVSDLADQDAPEEDVRAIVDDFKSKYENEAPAASAPVATQPAQGLGSKLLEATVPSVNKPFEPVDEVKPLLDPTFGMIGLQPTGKKIEQSATSKVATGVARVAGDITSVGARMAGGLKEQVKEGFATGETSFDTFLKGMSNEETLGSGVKQAIDEGNQPKLLKMLEKAGISAIEDPAFWTIVTKFGKIPDAMKEMFQARKVDAGRGATEEFLKHNKDINLVFKEEGFSKLKNPESQMQAAKARRAEFGGKIEHLIESAKQEGVKVDVRAVLDKVKDDILEDYRKGLTQGTHATDQFGKLTLDGDVAAQMKVLEEFEASMGKFVDNRSALVGTRPTAPAADASGNLVLPEIPAAAGPKQLPASTGSALSTEVKAARPEVGTHPSAPSQPASSAGQAPREVLIDGRTVPVDIANNLKKSFQGKVYDPQTPTGRIQKRIADRIQFGVNDAIAASLGEQKGALLKKFNSRWQNNLIMEDVLRENLIDATMKRFNKPNALRQIAKKAAIVGGAGAGVIEAKRLLIKD